MFVERTTSVHAARAGCRVAFVLEYWSSRLDTGLWCCSPILNMQRPVCLLSAGPPAVSTWQEGNRKKLRHLRMHDNPPTPQTYSNTPVQNCLWQPIESAYGEDSGDDGVRRLLSARKCSLTVKTRLCTYAMCVCVLCKCVCPGEESKLATEESRL